TWRERPEMRAAVDAVLGSVELDKGLYRQAEAHLRRAATFQEAAYGPAAAEVLESRHALACVLRHQSRPAEAEAMFWQTLQRRAATLGPRDRLTQLTALQLADLLIEQARGDQAKPLLLQTL